jgi:hypothetical protein
MGMGTQERIMCIECGCEALGSETGIVPVIINDVSTNGESGLTK